MYCQILIQNATLITDRTNIIFGGISSLEKSQIGNENDYYYWYKDFKDTWKKDLKREQREREIRKREVEKKLEQEIKREKENNDASKYRSTSGDMRMNLQVCESE